MKYTKITPTDTLIYALGGLGEVGRNMTCIEYLNEIIIVDCGIAFLDGKSLGINYVICDFTSLKNSKKRKTLVITHGHEDHIGAIPYLLKSVDIEGIYGSSFSCEIIRKKLIDRRMSAKTKLLQVVDKNSKVTTEHFTIGFFETTHSIPESLGIIINNDNGRIIHTGDYKFDLTPVGTNSDYQVMGFLGTIGVDVLLSDSTNSEVCGFSISEKDVAAQIDKIFKNTEGRLIISTFASNVNRVGQIVNIANKYGRKVAIIGRSMNNIVEIGRKMKKINLEESNIVLDKNIKKVKDKELCIICTGSQGEPMAALNRIANNEHKFIKLRPTDTVIFSSSPIPGNNDNVENVINKLWRMGANVLTRSVFNNLHTTGHASSNEQKLLFQLLKPKYFMPVHGEHRMLETHARTAAQVGVPLENSAVVANGDILILRQQELFYSNTRVDAEDVYISENDCDNLSATVVRDRKIMSSSGIVTAIVNYDSQQKIMLSKVLILSRGFTNLQNSKNVLKNAEEIVFELVEELIQEPISPIKIKETIRKHLESYLYSQTHRNPIVVPVILDIHK